MKAKQFQEAIKTAFHKHFPCGYISITKLALGGGIGIYCGLIGDLADVSAKIRENDPLMLRAYIHDNFIYNDESTDLDKVCIDFDGCRVSVLPTNKYMFCESHKIQVRKINTDPEKAIAKMESYFIKMKETVTVLAADQRIIQQEKIPQKYL